MSMAPTIPMIWTDPTPHQIANNLIMMLGLANASRIYLNLTRNSRVGMVDNGADVSSPFYGLMRSVGVTMTVLAWLTKRGVPSSVVELLRDGARGGRTSAKISGWH